MTYTFKLARRLAVSRHFIMLPALLLFAACSGSDATAPEANVADPSTTAWSPRDLTPVMVRINPSNVTLETNQLIHFRAHGRTSAGDSVAAAVSWSATGGTILPDGRFSAAAVGTFRVIGRNRVRGELQADTTTVMVVRRQPKLASLEISPNTASLTPGVNQTFAAVGRLRNGSVVPVGVTWSAGGGAIDPGGTFVAGDTAGTFRIIAINTAGTIADTATVTITAPPSPPPPPPAPTPPPAPVLEKVTLVPGSVTLATRATKQFVAYGRMNTGDSVAVNVTFAATGGTVTYSGLYTAGSTSGTFRVIASVGGLADTSAVTVKTPLGSGNLPGIAFGLTNLLSSEFNAPYTGTLRLQTPSEIFAYLDAARAKKMRVVISLAGSSSNYKNPDGSLSVTLWKQRVDRFKGMDLSSYINDGTLIGHYVLDEPHDPTNWGGHTVTFAEIETLAQYSKELFPTLTTFVRVHAPWLKGYSWKYLDAAWAQYSARKGDLNTYISSNVSSAKALGLGLIVGLNVLDGGDGSSGIPGTYAGAYAMSAAELKRYGVPLAQEPYACGFFMWTKQASYISRPDIVSAMFDLSEAATNRATAPCKVH